MSLFSFLRRVAGEADPASPACFGCSHFRNDPAFLAAELPGLSVLSSPYASVRSEDGVCTVHQTIVNGRKGCPRHAPIDAAGRASEA